MAIRQSEVQQERDPKLLVSTYIGAVGDKQFDVVSSLLHPNMAFKMGATTLDKSGCMAALQRLGPILRCNVIKQLFVEGDSACVVYEFVTNTSVGAVPSVEWLTVVDGLIQSSHLMFDRSRWPEVLEELRLRTTPSS